MSYEQIVQFFHAQTAPVIRFAIIVKENYFTKKENFHFSAPRDAGLFHSSTFRAAKFFLNINIFFSTTAKKITPYFRIIAIWKKIKKDQIFKHFYFYFRIFLFRDIGDSNNFWQRQRQKLELLKMRQSCLQYTESIWSAFVNIEFFNEKSLIIS